MAIISILLLFFKYISPKEKKELKLQRDKQFREVERLLKKGDKESILQVIQILDSLEEISDKLGDFGLITEFRERSNNLRRQLGLEVKASLGGSVQDINKFIQQLMRGPYGKGAMIEISMIGAAASGGEVGSSSKSLVEEGEEILARLRSLRKEKGEEKPVILFPSTQEGVVETPLTQTTPLTESSSSEEAPPVIKLPVPKLPPKISVPPPPMPPSAVPASSKSPPRGSIPSIRPPPRPMEGPIENPIPPFRPPPLEPVSSTASPKKSPQTPFRPVAMPIENPIKVPPSEGISVAEREIEEPQILPPSKISSKIEVPVVPDEKSEILARLNKELPLLPENEKYNIVEELLKRPAGKLRETWFKIVVHKNKQYAAEQ